MADDRSEMERLADRLHEYRKMRYIGDCKCGDCQLVPLSLIAELESALRAASVKAGEGVAVRPLEWRQRASDMYDADVYLISDTFGQGPRKYVIARGSTILGYFHSADDAKAAAQADYEARIRSALVVEPAPTASVGAMREALEFYANEWLGSVNELGAIVYEPTSALIANQSDGGTPNATTIAAIEELERGGGTTSDPFAGKVPCNCHDPVSQRLCLDKDRCYTIEAQGGPSDTPPAALREAGRRGS